MSQRVIIRKANHVIDVFFGEEGFNQKEWTRFLLVGNFLKFIKGAKLSHQDFNVVKKELNL